MPFAELRALCHVRAATLHEQITALVTASRIEKIDGAFHLTGS